MHVKAGDQGTIRISLGTGHARVSNLVTILAFASQSLLRAGEHCLPLGIFPSNGLDYADIPTTNSDGFFGPERLALEQLIASNFERAAVVEAWGEVMTDPSDEVKGNLGLHVPLY